MCLWTRYDHRQILGDQMERRSTCSCKTDTGNSCGHIYTNQVREPDDFPVQTVPVFLSPNTRARNFEQTIRTIVPADFDGDTSVAPYRIAFFTEVKVVEFVIRVRGRW